MSLHIWCVLEGVEVNLHLALRPEHAGQDVAGQEVAFHPEHAGQDVAGQEVARKEFALIGRLALSVVACLAGCGSKFHSGWRRTRPRLEVPKPTMPKIFSTIQSG
jgi:hypothetical protein